MLFYQLLLIFGATFIFKYNVSNSVSFVTRHSDFETLHCCFGHVSDEVMCHVLDNVKDVKKICFPTQKYICYSCTSEKMHQCNFSENFIHSSEHLGLICSDFLELLILFYSKYKWVITFLNNYFSYCNIAFLYKKSEAIEVIKSIFQIWSNTTFYSMKRLHTNNRREYVTLELQSFLRE